MFYRKGLTMGRETTTLPIRELVAEQRLFSLPCWEYRAEDIRGYTIPAYFSYPWATQCWRGLKKSREVASGSFKQTTCSASSRVWSPSWWGDHSCQSFWQQITLYVFFLGLSGNLQDSQAIQPAYTTWEMMHSGGMMGQSLHPNISHVSYYWFWA